jgi:hypothetical protein
VLLGGLDAKPSGGQGRAGTILQINFPYNHVLPVAGNGIEGLAVGGVSGQPHAARRDGGSVILLIFFLKKAYRVEI